MGKMKDQIKDYYDLAYAEGWLAALENTGWTCPECGNIYGLEVDGCPNVAMDEAAARHRALVWKSTR